MPTWTPAFTAEELAAEEWRPVVGFEALYEVSSLGRVKSLRKCTSTFVGRIVKARSKGSKGYLSVNLSPGSGRTKITHLLHLVVARAFLGPPPEGKEVNHEDGIKTNPRLSNLSYVTKPENHRHAVVIGLHTFDAVRGERNVNAKLTDDKVRLIRRRLREGVGVSAIGREVGMPYQRIQEIRDGYGWNHIQ